MKKRFCFCAGLFVEVLFVLSLLFSCNNTTSGGNLYLNGNPPNGIPANSNPGNGGSSYTITDSSTVSGIVTSFNAATAATIAVPSGNSYVANTSSRDITTLDNDYQNAMAGITEKITIDLENETGWDSSVSRSGELVTVTTTGSGELVTVTTTGSVEIEITGTAAEKTAFFFQNKKEKPMKITFNNANFSSENYPPIEFDKKAKIYLVASGTNAITDGRNYGTGYGSKFTDSTNAATYPDRDVTQKWVEKGSSKKGSIYIKGQAILSGDGTLTLSENYKHGIYATDYIRVFGGKWNINSTGRNGIQCVNGFVMDDGEISISGKGSNTNNESRGIIVEGMDFEDGAANEFPGEGFIVIKGGKITINTVSKAISAKWDIDDDAGSTDTTDDPYPYVLISGGEIDITTTGTPKDESNVSYNFTDADGVTVSEKTKLSPEGIEGKQAVIITGGKITLNVTDDGINASREDSKNGGWVSISGGNIYINSSKNDAIDSNGNLYISGGVVVAYGTSTPECAFDCDRNTFAITGGLLLGVGTNNYSTPTSSATTQGTFILSGSNYGSGTLAVANASGDVVFAYDIPTGIANATQLVMILSSPKIEEGTYTVKKGATATGGETFHNLYTTFPTISGGTESATFTTSSGNFVQSSTSGMTNNGPQEGGRPNNGPGF